MVGCVGKNRSLMLDVQKRDGSSKPETLAGVSVGSANHRLTLRASGCLESLTTTEVTPIAKKMSQIFTVYSMTL